MPDPMVDILNTKLKKNFFFVFFFYLKGLPL